MRLYRTLLMLLWRTIDYHSLRCYGVSYAIISYPFMAIVYCIILRIILNHIAHYETLSRHVMCLQLLEYHRHCHWLLWIYVSYCMSYWIILHIIRGSLWYVIVYHLLGCYIMYSMAYYIGLYSTL